MISVTEAKNLLLENLPFSQGMTLPLFESSGRILAEDIAAPVDHPAFDQTAVDGYAIHAEDCRAGKIVIVRGEIKAGDAAEPVVEPGFAVRIFTGAPVPASAGAVVMQELTETNGKTIKITDSGIRVGANIRRKGEQIQQGQQAMRRGEILNAISIGFLASLGINEVVVTRLPKVEMVITGNEFATDIAELAQGKIFESNGVMLRAALNEVGIQANYCIQEDHLDGLISIIAGKAADSDVLIVTGGVSVGDYDFTRKALETLEYDIIFHKVNQRPGKPILFARRGNHFVFGLPGNPRSVMVGWLEYVLPFLKGWMGAESIFAPVMRLPSASSIRNKPGKCVFLAGIVGPEGVTVLDRQGSHMLRTLGEAHCLVVLQPERGDVAIGETVDIHWIA